MAGIRRGWHPDPFGVHELRYFTFDGNPTRLVRDGDGWSHDAPPVAPHRSAIHPSIRAEEHHQTWQLDPHGMHEERFITCGEPTRMVRDRGVEFYDEPPPTHDGVHEIHLTAPTAVSRNTAGGRWGETDTVAPDATSLPPPSRGTTFRRLFRYGSVSVVSTVIGLSLLGLFVGVLRWPATWSNVVAVGIATVPSFELNRRWVWAQDGPRSILRQALPYFLLSFAGLVISTIAVRLASGATINSTRLVHTAAVEMANIAAYGSLWIVQFVLCDRILFRSRSISTVGDEWNPVAVGVARAPGALVSSEVMA